MTAATVDTWEDIRARVLARDGSRCTVSWLLGGACSETLDVHHLIPREEGGTDDESNLITACHAHHPVVEAIRREVLRRRGRLTWRRCSHAHPYPGGREECERKLNAELLAAA